MQLTFGQKLLTAFGILLLLVMGAFTLSGDLRLQSTTETYVNALIDDTVQQSTSSIAEWLNTRLVMTEATAKALENAENDEEARVILQAITTGGGFRDVYVGRTDGYMLMKSPEANATLPADYDPRQRPWYKKAMSLGSASFTEPYQDASTNDMIISTLAPVKRGEYEGVAGADIGLGAIAKTLSTVTLADTGYAALINERGTYCSTHGKALSARTSVSSLAASRILAGTLTNTVMMTATGRPASIRSVKRAACNGIWGRL